jgi:hypothetical protein
MKSLGFSRCALHMCVAAAMLAGCGGSQPPIGVPGVISQAPASAHRHPRTNEALIYAFRASLSPMGVIYGYPGGNVIDTFQTSLWEAGGACADDRGDVFLAGGTLHSSEEEATILEYPYGETSSSNSVTFSLESGRQYAYACSVDTSTGNVATAVYTDIGEHVVVLPDFQDDPTLYSVPFPVISSVGYDGSGNLFALGYSSVGGHYAFAELPRGGTGFKTVSLDLGAHVYGVRTVQWDGKKLTIEATLKEPHTKAEYWPNIVYRLKVSHFRATVLGSTLYDGRGLIGGGESWIQSNLGIIVLAIGKIRVGNYPEGGQMKKLAQPIGRTPIGTVAVPASGARSR